MKHVGSYLVVVSALLLGACQGGEVMGSVTTDYGIALATTEQTAPGDIDSWLVAKTGDALLGELTWDADSHELSASIATTTVTSDALDLSGRTLEQFNELLYRLWEIEATNPTTTTCLDDGEVICCRDDGWHCGQSQLAR